MSNEELRRFIASKKYAVLSSLSPDNIPQSALVGIAVTAKLEVVFDTLNTSRKYRNLLRSPQAALVIGWDDEITLQYEGIARAPGASELKHYQEAYFAKWPEGRAHLKWPGIVYFVVEPKWIRYSDFNEGSRGIFEMTF